MAKKIGSNSEWRRYKKIEQENEKLRKEISKLRKQVRTSLVEERPDPIKKEPIVTPTCENCGNEDVHFISIKRADGNFEIKVCRSCQHKSELLQTNK